jgi:hypothetical protein
MDKTAIGVGIACMIAAIVGGGVKLLGTEIPAICSTKRQVMLFVFGFLLAAVGNDTSGSSVTQPEVEAAAPVAAQGVTGAAIGGRVLSVDSTPVEQANVHVVNASNGEHWRTTTTARGRYFIEYLSIGGPYQIEVRAVGYVLGVKSCGAVGKEAPDGERA